MSYTVKVKGIKFEDWDSDSQGRAPSKMTLTLPDRARENAMYEIDCILDAIEDRVGVRPEGYTPVSGTFHG